jgi:hypothetical protein
MIRKLFFLMFLGLCFDISQQNKASNPLIKRKFGAARMKRAALGPLWPTRRIPFTFSNIMEFDFDERNLIKHTLKQVEESLSIEGETCIEFVERENEKDYILFVNEGDCSSSIGYTSGRNNISLADGCMKRGTIIHEVMHRFDI